MLTLQQILSAGRKPEPTAVPVPGWGFDVYVRAIPPKRYDTWMAGPPPPDPPAKAAAAGPNDIARFLAYCFCDEEGTFLCPTSGEAEHFAVIFGSDDKKSMADVARILRVAQKLNGLTQEAVQDAVKSATGEPGASVPPPAGP